MAKSGVCKFCNEEGTLIEAHVLPKRMDLLNSLPKKLFTLDKTSPPKRSPRGSYDKDLLCHTCEHRYFEPLDTYAFDVLFNRRLEATAEFGFGEWLLRFRGADGNRLKLFVLSVIWRASASSRPDFEGCDLGGDQDLLREMVAHSKPGAPSYMPTIVGFEADQGLLGTTIVPGFGRHESLQTNVSSFWLGGYRFQSMIGQVDSDVFGPAKSILLGGESDVLAFRTSAASGKAGASFKRAFDETDKKYGFDLGHRIPRVARATKASRLE